MTDDPTKYLPDSLQFTSPVKLSGQEYIDAVRSLTGEIMDAFINVLPSNYVSQVNGPFYTMQFQAVAEQLAKTQISAQEVLGDAEFDFTRPEFLYQILGYLVFPDRGGKEIPEIDGTATYRSFLKGMVALLLAGATPLTIEEGIELLTDDLLNIVEKGISERDVENSAYDLSNVFEYEVNISAGSGQEFPTDPITLQKNLAMVLEALAPAEGLYQYRHVFTEVFGQIFTDALTLTFTDHHYEDFRKFCLGAKEITGTAGISWTDRALFQDLNRDFSSVSPGATLTVTGTNAGTYRVTEVLRFPVGADSTSVAFTTASGVSGNLVVGNYGEVLSDTLFPADLPEGEVLTISTGSNAGSYRMEEFLGTAIGPVGDPLGKEIVSSDTSNPVIVTTANPHGLSTGQTVYIMGNTDPALNAEWVVLGVPSTTTFTVNKLGIGGIDGKVAVGAYQARMAASLLRLGTRMSTATTGLSYTVGVDRLGVRTPQEVTGEDASVYFYI